MINTIPKPKDSMWTDEQWQAITAEGKDILVAAAAGSGKTAVLVERIIRKITNTNNPVDVDRLLVATFTNAAAAEMRKRVGEALEKELQTNPSSLHLRRQLSLLNRASISTLHSFCMEIVRKYYYKLDLDPKFRIADQTEAELLREEVLDEIFEEEYSTEENERFYDLVDRYSSDRSDLDLQVLIRKLYDFARANPHPNEWLEQIKRSYELKDEATIEDLPWISDLLADIHLQLEGAEQLLTKAMDLTHEPGAPAAYAENLEVDLEGVRQLRAHNDWTALYEGFQSLQAFGRLKSARGKDIDKNLQEQIKGMRDSAKKIVKKIEEELFQRSPQSYLKDLKEMAPAVGKLIELVQVFSERFDQAKKEHGLVDFSDLEHYALAVLAEELSTDSAIPSEAALDYKQQFAEVLVDEYQDTNLVQETIIQLVSKGDNLFMVGDVKQSIYRFRLAEPGLFLQKYKKFTKDGTGEGLRIDLAKNFRSRSEVLDATNYIFKQLMDEPVGEIDYNEDAELKQGASYPDTANVETELLLVHREGMETEPQSENEAIIDVDELETAQLEARLVARKIKAMIESGYEVFDKELKRMRRMTYRDVIILLRSFGWAPTIMEEFKQAGIPVYAELSTGYFEAVEVSIMMSLLKTIDNPHQDIPLAAVLRSPIVGLTENDLAEIRTANPRVSYYEAMQEYMKQAEETEKIEKVRAFYEKLTNWRTCARQGALSELIWQIYSETGYYNFVGGIPGGKQRQANLRALYDRARQYEETSFRGLFRFLRFIERMQDRGDDLGAARALGEQEDVVRLMTIHKSKGLEFPIVFVSGLGKQFNLQDLRAKTMLHKNLGFASKYVHPQLRISYPTIAQHAMKRRMQMEMIAEEMRVLYVALTRAKEKLILTATVKDIEKELNSWSDALQHPEWFLPPFERSKAISYLNWLGPALLRHQHVHSTLASEQDNQSPEEVKSYPAQLKAEIVEAAMLGEEMLEEAAQHEELQEALRNWEKASVQSEWHEDVYKRLNWRYPYAEATDRRSKQSVTEIKRTHQQVDEYSDHRFVRQYRAPISERPLFMQSSQLTSAERGTAMHAVMQHIDFELPVSEESIAAQIAEMVQKELLTQDQADAVEIESITAFFASELGQKVLQADNVRREVPFTMALPAEEAYPEWHDGDETVLVQGVIDCLVNDEDGLTLIDYKSDNITDRFKGGFQEAKPLLEERYRVQIDMYAKALEQIWKAPIAAKYLYFFDGSHVIKM
ncbi:helicase-exonuclease AddAB subunit AddA [Bacillus tianshenii]|nr:helicase-exonuclease AddAB subunit AddA [Bacillus tianshenii]